MKIALLLSGLTRSSKICYGNLDRFLLSKHEVDIYIHTWDISNVSINGQESETEISINELINLYTPKKIIVEDYFLKRDWLNKKYLKYPKKEGTYDRSISMFYKIEECFNLVQENYDFLIRSRMDLLLYEEINFSNLSIESINIPKHQSNRQTYIENQLAYSIPPDSYGITDCLSIGTYDIMKHYCNVFSNLDKLCLEMRHDYHPEFLTLKNLEMYNTKIHRFDLNYCVVRKLNK